MLNSERHVRIIDVTFQTPYTSERGGMMCLGIASGITIVEYAIEPSGSIPIGVLANDIEYIDLSRQPHPCRNRETDFPMGVAGLLTKGQIETDWLYIVGTLIPGSPAYVGPSGTITNLASLGGTEIGHFLGTLQSNPHFVTFRGLGFSTSYQEPRTHNIVVINNQNDRVRVFSPGFAKVKIHIGRAHN